MMEGFGLFNMNQNEQRFESYSMDDNSESMEETHVGYFGWILLSCGHGIAIMIIVNVLWLLYEKSVLNDAQYIEWTYGYGKEWNHTHHAAFHIQGNTESPA